MSNIHSEEPKTQRPAPTLAVAAGSLELGQQKHGAAGRLDGEERPKTRTDVLIKVWGGCSSNFKIIIIHPPPSRKAVC